MAGMQIFTASGTFTPVTGRTYKIIAIGGGYATLNALSVGAPGSISTAIWTAPNTTAIAVTVGAACVYSATNGVLTAAGASSFGSIVTANPGSRAIAIGVTGTSLGVQLGDITYADGLVGIRAASDSTYAGSGAGAGSINASLTAITKGSVTANPGAVVITWDV